MNGPRATVGREEGVTISDNQDARLAAAAPQPAGVAASAAIRGVMRTRAFRRLWYTTALSSLGDWMGLLATTAMATSLAHGYSAQNYALGGVLVVKLLPAIVLGPLAGAFADRFDRRHTMIVGDAVRFVLLLLTGIAANALVSGAISGVFDRYQGRVAWLASLGFAVLLVKMLNERRQAGTALKRR